MNLIEPAVDELMVTWHMSRYCNFACSYCGSADYLQGERPSLAEAKKRFNSLYQLIKHHPNIHINLTGGEPTQLDGLIDLCKHIKQTNSSIILNVNSNGTKSAEYYLRLVQWVDSLDISTHLDFIKLKPFMKKMAKIRRQSDSLCIHIMAEKAYFSQFKWLCSILSRYHFQFQVLKIVQETYDEEWEQEIQRWKNEATVKDVWVDGKLTSSLDVKNQMWDHITDHSSHAALVKQNPFLGWQCWAPSTSLCLYGDQLFGGMCERVKYGCVHDAIQLINQIECQNSICSCNADIRAKKQKGDENVKTNYA